MNNYKNIPVPVIKRLPRYHRYLEELKNLGFSHISSKELSERMGVTASQIRQDLNCFGGFGIQGYGYAIETLYSEIGAILGLDEPKTAILVGAGNLGRAIATHLKFERKGFDLIGIFDADPELCGKSVGKIKIHSTTKLESFCKRRQPDIAILCIPGENAAAMTERLIELGIKGFWNFTQYDISHTHKGIAVENVHLGDSLMTLCYRVSHENCSDVDSQ